MRRWATITMSATGTVATIGSRQDLAPWHLVLPPEQRNRDRYGLSLGAEGERQGKQKFVPAVQEGQDRGRHHARESDRQEDFVERLQTARAIDERSFLDFWRKLTEKSGQQPDAERRGERQVRQHEPRIRIDEMNFT